MKIEFKGHRHGGAVCGKDKKNTRAKVNNVEKVHCGCQSKSKYVEVTKNSRGIKTGNRAKMF